MSLNVKSRWTAFAIHLGISIIVLLVLLGIIFFVWFPRDLIFAGGIDGLKILMGVDLVLGPLLTLMVYKHDKKELKWDLTAIGVLQITCLAGGLWLIFNERPLLQVLADDGIHLLSASDFSYYDVAQPDLPGSAPKFVLLDIPENRSQLGNIKFTSEFVEKKPFAFRSDLYLPMPKQSIQSFASRIRFIQEVMPEKEVDNLPRVVSNDCSWVPVHSKHVLGYACVSYKNGIERLSERKL
jgi:hypothetical protein